MIILKTIKKFFVLLFLGILKLFGHDVTPRIRVLFADRNAIGKQASLVAFGTGKYKKGDEVNILVKNSRNNPVTNAAVVVEDLGWRVKVVRYGSKHTELIDRKKIKKVFAITKKRPYATANSK